MSSTTSLAPANVLPVLREFLGEIFAKLEEAGEDEAKCLKLARRISIQKAKIDTLLRANTQLEDDLAASIDKLHAWIADHIRADWAAVSSVWEDWLSIRDPGETPNRLTNVGESAKESVVSRSGSMAVPHTSEDTESREPESGTTVRDGSAGFGTTGDEGEVTGKVRDASQGTTSGGGPPPSEGWSPEVRSVVERVEKRVAGQATERVDELETETAGEGKRVIRRSSRKGKEKEVDEDEEEIDDEDEDSGPDDGVKELDEDCDGDGAPSGSVDPDKDQTPRTTRSSRIRSKATVSDTEDEDEDAEEPPARATRKRNASNPPEEPRKRLRKAVVEVPAQSSGSRESVRTAAVETKGIESQMGEWFTAESLEKKPVEFRKELLGYLLKCRKEDHKDYSSVCDWCATTGISRCFGPTKTKTCFYCVRMKKKCSHSEKAGKGKTKEKKPAKEKKSDGRGKGKTRAETAVEKVHDADVIEIDAEDNAAGPSQPPPTPRKVTLRVKNDPATAVQGDSGVLTRITKTLDTDNKLGRRSAQIQTLEREISQWEIDSDLLLARIAAGKEMLAVLRRRNSDV